MNPPDPTVDTIARIEQAVGGADRGVAINLAVEALRRGVRHPLVWTLVAEGLESQGRLPEALNLLQRASALAPDDARVWFGLGRVLFPLGRREEAGVVLDRGLTLSPDDYRGRIDAGTLRLRLGELKAASEHFQRAAEIAPEAAEPLSALAVVAGLAGNSGAARSAATRALALAPALISAQIAIARADSLDGEPAQAAGRLSRLLVRTDLADAQRIDIHDLRAECFDTLDRPAEAFADYAARNDVQRRVHAPSLAEAGQEGHCDRARRLADWFEATPPGSWRSPASAGLMGADAVGARATRQHAFLIGFPRSGTTLLEKALSSHPDIVSLEEVDILGAVGNPLLAADADLDRLIHLPAPESDALRETYWRGVGEAMDAPIGGRIFIDKLPLHTSSLPLIATLFPGARILFALRDPRDVVFSCFRRRLRINAAMFEFLTLDGAARYYDAVMRMAVACHGVLPLAVHAVRHEAVVADFEGELGRALDFVGAPWNPDVRNFAALARTSTRTPSAPQVARGLNADGVAQWRRYQAQLAPIAPILEPWVARFGYDAD
jgi:tetratricopeptide (TPR) repeat protein